MVKWMSDRLNKSKRQTLKSFFLCLLVIHDKESSYNMKNHVKRKDKRMYNPVWDAVIADAERKLDDAKALVGNLRKTVRNFRKLRDEGHEWPTATQQQ